MKHKGMLSAALMLAALIASASSFASADKLAQVEQVTIARVREKVKAFCGLDEVNARDPRLPLPRVPADKAFADLQRAVVAAYLFRNVVRDPRNPKWQMIYKKTNGGYLGTTDLDNHIVSFLLTDGGIQARVKITRRSGNELNIQYRCARQDVSEEEFYRCLGATFVEPLANRICLQLQEE